MALSLVFLVGFGFAQGAADRARGALAGGVRRLHWSSEQLMATAPLDDLAAEPLRAILELHVQPPALDALRTVLVLLAPGDGLQAQLVNVDQALNVLWSACYAALGCLIYAWLRSLLGWPTAAAVAAVFLLHPAAILYTTVLEVTMPSALLVTWCGYELWRLSRRQGSAVRLALSFLALFFVRSLFQWPFLAVFVASLALLRARRRELLLFVALTVPVVGAYVAKQQALFGLTTTTSLSGYNCLRSIGLLAQGYERGDPLRLDFSAELRRVSEVGPPARVLLTEFKSTGVPNYNHLGYLAAKDLLLSACRQEYSRLSWHELALRYSYNGRLYLQPSSAFGGEQPVLRVVPWRAPFDWLFSGARLVLLVGMSGLWWLVVQLAPVPGIAAPRVLDRVGTGARLAAGLGLALPALVMVAESVMLERAENMRFKFLLEPLLLVFFATQAHSALGALRARRRVGTSRPAAG